MFLIETFAHAKVGQCPVVSFYISMETPKVGSPRGYSNPLKPTGPYVRITLDCYQIHEPQSR